MKFTQAFLLAAVFAASMQAIDAKKCKAKSSSSSSTSVSGGSNDAATSSASSSASSSTSTVSVSGMTPNGKKAGVSGGQAVKFLGDHIGAWNDWGAAGASDQSTSADYVPMVWGNGDDSINTGLSSQSNSKRLADFKALPVGTYKYVMGFNEFDFHGTGSSGKMDVDSAASLWDQLMAKHKAAGTKLISPSCALQADETMLRPFLDAVTTKPDCIAVHIFQDSIEGVKTVLNHYKTKYSDYNCFWITEVAYANYQNGAHNYGSVSDTNSLMQQYVELFENDDTVKAYFISDADNGDNGDLTPNHDGTSLSSLGSAYLSAISSYNSKRALKEIGHHALRHVRRAAAASRRSPASFSS